MAVKLLHNTCYIDTTMSSGSKLTTQYMLHRKYVRQLAVYCTMLAIIATIMTIEEVSFVIESGRQLVSILR